MALDLGPGALNDYPHHCSLPWPVDPEVPEGHVCECGRRWVYQPAHWQPLLTLEELRMRHDAGEFLRGVIPAFHADDESESAVIVPIRP